jgi:predicted nucleotidyltransferase
MKVAGIIAEYNPFHKGHKYHINKTLEITNSDYIVAVMSGHFTQRGTPAVCNKWARAEMALNNGADLIIELPLLFSIRSAEYFAQASMRLLNQLNIVDNVVFGSEHGQLEALQNIASLLLKDDKYFEKRLKHYLKEGTVFPAARKKALLDLIKLNKENNSWSQQNIFEILNGSNNILGIEYLKAKQKFNLDLNLKTIKRIGQKYYSDDRKKEYISATAVRNAVYEGKIDSIKEKIPNISYEILRQEIKENKIPINKEHLGIMLLTKIRKLSIDELTEIHDINHDLAVRIKKAAEKSGNYKQLIASLNTRSFTKTRFQRIILNILFDINKDIINNHDYKGPSYIRVLGFTTRGEKLLSKLERNSKLPVIMNPARFVKNITFANKNLLENSLSYDLYATDIYTLLYKNPDHRLANLDFKNKIVKVN